MFGYYKSHGALYRGFTRTRELRNPPRARIPNIPDFTPGVGNGIVAMDMSFSVDLRNLLQSWPYDPEEDARIVKGEDGRTIMQVRTPLGIEQYELEGRPDGERPRGWESALDYFLDRLEKAKREGRESSFELTARECGELFNEGTLYYFRYVRLFQLKDWARTVRDTERNLRAFDLVRKYAAREEDRLFLEKWRPYIIRVNATAASMLELEKGDHAAALSAAERAISQIDNLEDIDDETFRFERERSLNGMRELTEQIERNRPRTETEQLESQLLRAVERQEFEKAAELRDRIKALKQQA